MRCHEFREMMDSYLSDELLVETNHEVLQHLESCAACRSELAARRELRTRLRSAVKGAPETQINPNFARKLRNDLRETALRPTIWGKLKNKVFLNSPVLATSAACLVLAVFLGVMSLRQSPVPENNIAQQNQINEPNEIARPVDTPVTQAIRAAWREMAHEAVGDHENCALHFRLEENPITLDEAAEKYGAFNKDLDKTVMKAARKFAAGEVSDKTAGKIEFLEAHSCIFQGRRFAHVVLRRQNRIISVLVTETNLPDENADPISNQSNGTMQAASFQVDHYAVFIVSDLTEQENLIVAQTLSPAVRRHIEGAKA